MTNPSHFVTCFAAKIRGVIDAHPLLIMQAFLMCLRPSRFFWSLVERLSMTITEMLQRVSQYVIAEALVAGKREDHKSSCGAIPRATLGATKEEARLA
ncbi:hypothetical protein BHE74_00003676 [Ensete ventricosum]|nr:hypothetical protein GW17_00017314 [Ensete ventricosum]RWW87495.1 hypothetical protein BHE74_00003676 [Ensete ventricosum]